MSRSYASKGRSPCASLLSPPASYPGSSGSAQDRSLYVRFLHFWQFTGNFVTLLCLRDVDGSAILNSDRRGNRRMNADAKGRCQRVGPKSSKRRSTTDRRLSNGVHGSPRCSTAFSSDLTSNLVTGSAMAGSPSSRVTGSSGRSLQVRPQTPWLAPSRSLPGVQVRFVIRALYGTSVIDARQRRPAPIPLTENKTRSLDV